MKLRRTQHEVDQGIEVDQEIGEGTAGFKRIIQICFYIPPRTLAIIITMLNLVMVCGGYYSGKDAYCRGGNIDIGESFHSRAGDTSRSLLVILLFLVEATRSHLANVNNVQ